MQQPIIRQTLLLIGLLFLAGAVWISAAQILGRMRGRRIWITYLVELGVIGAILGPAALGGPSWLVAVLLLGLACGRELYRVLAASGQSPDVWLGQAGGAAVLGASAAYGFSAAQLVLAAVAFLALTRATWSGEGRRMGTMAGATLLGLAYPWLGIAHLHALGAGPDGFGYVLFCYGLTELNDTLAFLVGTTIGRRKPWPTLSPNKTVAGCVAGVVGTVACAPLFAFALPRLSTVQLLTGGLLLAVFGLVGDLVASRFKREAGVKDYATVVPTHGGVLDVYDSLLFVAPLFHGWLAVSGARP
jgi:phosphatidate cytidylyltransferase